jgi:hypothetical protein
MSLEELHNDLDALKTELEKSDIGDSEELNKLNALTKDIQNVLEDPGELSFGHHRVLMLGIDDAIKNFEVSHPTLTGLLNNVVNSLNALGI